DDAVSRAAAGFAVQDVPASSALAALAAADKATAFVVTDGDRWVLLTDPSPDLVASPLPAERSAAWGSLDVTIAHRVLIDRLWQLQDTEDVVGFEHDVPTAVAAAQRTGGGAVLFYPRPGQAGARAAPGGARSRRRSVPAGSRCCSTRRRSRRSPPWRRPASGCRASRRCSRRSRG